MKALIGQQAVCLILLFIACPGGSAFIDGRRTSTSTGSSQVTGDTAPSQTEVTNGSSEIYMTDTTQTKGVLTKMTDNTQTTEVLTTMSDNTQTTEVSTTMSDNTQTKGVLTTTSAVGVTPESVKKTTDSIRTAGFLTTTSSLVGSKTTTEGVTLGTTDNTQITDLLTTATHNENILAPLNFRLSLIINRRDSRLRSINITDFLCHKRKNHVLRKQKRCSSVNRYGPLDVLNTGQRQLWRLMQKSSSCNKEAVSSFMEMYKGGNTCGNCLEGYQRQPKSMSCEKKGQTYQTATTYQVDFQTNTHPQTNTILAITPSSNTSHGNSSLQGKADSDKGRKQTNWDLYWKIALLVVLKCVAGILCYQVCQKCGSRKLCSVCSRCANCKPVFSAPRTHNTTPILMEETQLGTSTLIYTRDTSASLQETTMQPFKEVHLEGTNEYILYTARNIGTRNYIELFATHLQLPEAKYEPEVELWHRKVQGYSDCVYNVLKEWQQLYGKEATLYRLVCALSKVEHKKTAAGLAKLFKERTGDVIAVNVE